MKILATGLLLTIISFCYGQKDQSGTIAKSITVTESRAHVEFLAADEMKGRDTGSPELEIAGNYIAFFFARHNLRAPKNHSYFQPVSLEKIVPPSSGSVTIGTNNFTLKDNFGHVAGGDLNWSGEFVFVGYGDSTDFEKVDVKNKVAIALFGRAEQNNVPKSLFTDAPLKNALAKSKGALGLIEVTFQPGVPFQSLQRYLQREKVVLKGDDAPVTHLLIQSPSEDFIKTLKENNRINGSLDVSGIALKKIFSRNIAGVIQGTDPTLSKEFIVLTAHYDHIGIGKKNAEQDSIFNGARDNALGTTALLSAAKYISEHPLKRSVLFIACTAEEKGMLGSAWYADHPLIPLENCIFNLNADGGGYNDKTAVVINGMEYLNSEKEIKQACSPFGVTANADPVPEMNLYSSSDNISFARKGIPAINFAPGFKGMDEEILKYYHKQEDESETVDFDYVIKYFRSYVNLAVILGNASHVPGWKPGAPFEKKAK